MLIGDPLLHIDRSQKDAIVGRAEGNGVVVAAYHQHFPIRTERQSADVSEAAIDGDRFLAVE